MNRIRMRAGFLVMAAVAVVGVSPASAQADLSGLWAARVHEDAVERGSGPELADYLGLPLNDAARLFADSWDASRLAVEEHQCKPHVLSYMRRGGFPLRIWQERDARTQQLIAIQIQTTYGMMLQTVWMDGRPHPSERARHTFAGFSTGTWEGNALKITTTHMKAGWVRRNGVPVSDRATLVTYYIRRGDVLSHVAFLTDVYLTTPHIMTTTYVLNPNLQGVWNHPCEAAEEIADRLRGYVPHHLPGQNPYLLEFATKYGLPVAVTRGGEATMYPEIQRTLPPPSRERQ